ncbi:hypothetical protein Dsin_013872 [Dipteronia sinensis]|uniref:Expansin-like EG45 domain-containing protein n=1 Tax=Dipteronia sinensis TaxID=43782 RepID=A0AAE0AL71_9ROSI|nr:hypothetical protein Dsin_013872 [Dipteronia sinensis]
MGTDMRILMMVGLVLCLTTVVHVGDAAQGDAVYFKPPYRPSTCFGNRDMGRLVTGVSEALWNDKKACGRKYILRCIGGDEPTLHPCYEGHRVVVIVVDFCQPPCYGIFNLSLNAFDVIANRDFGKVRVEYNREGVTEPSRSISSEMEGSAPLLDLEQEKEDKSEDCVRTKKMQRFNGGM